MLNNTILYVYSNNNIYFCQQNNKSKKQGVLHDCVAEIIPIEPDADNAAAGIVSFLTYTLFVINGTVFYFVYLLKNDNRRASTNRYYQ